MSTTQKANWFPKPWGPKWMRFLAAFGVAGAMLDMGLYYLNVRVELFWGIAGFDLPWIAAVFVLPFATGVAVGFIYGWGGKILAHFPPLVVLGISYYETMTYGAPAGAQLMPMAWWGFFVILAMEFSAFGAVMGELLLRRYYGTGNLPGTSDYAPADSEPLPEEDAPVQDKHEK